MPKEELAQLTITVIDRLIADCQYVVHSACLCSSAERLLLHSLISYRLWQIEFVSDVSRTINNVSYKVWRSLEMVDAVMP